MLAVVIFVLVYLVGKWLEHAYHVSYKLPALLTVSSLLLGAKMLALLYRLLLYHGSTGNPFDNVG